ncbi:MAG: type II toxin-antitoxin system PemK/MazF family toxin [Chloroflexi bacterium]|nr:type II toxin-antitoxin system PemK/MazF family toxin [Chloroflexota bacterium]
MNRGFPHYGDIYDVDLEPVVGSETGNSVTGRPRPVLVVSNDTSNEFSDTVTVIPLTGEPARRVYPFEVVIPRGVDGLTLDSRAKANQIRTVDKRRLVRFRGALPRTFYPQVKQAIKHHLDIT